MFTAFLAFSAVVTTLALMAGVLYSAAHAAIWFVNWLARG